MGKCVEDVPIGQEAQIVRKNLEELAENVQTIFKAVKPDKWLCYLEARSR